MIYIKYGTKGKAKSLGEVDENAGLSNIYLPIPYPKFAPCPIFFLIRDQFPSLHAIIKRHSFHVSLFDGTMNVLMHR